MDIRYVLKRMLIKHLWKVSTCEPNCILEQQIIFLPFLYSDKIAQLSQYLYPDFVFSPIQPPLITNSVLIPVDRFSKTLVKLILMSTWQVVRVSATHARNSISISTLQPLYRLSTAFLFSFCGPTAGLWPLLLRVNYKETSICLCPRCRSVLLGPSRTGVIIGKCDPVIILFFLSDI